MKGLEINGFVQTFNGWAVHSVNIGAEALHVRNTQQAPESPAILTFDDLECDFPDLECIRLDNGLRMHFSKLQLHGSRSRAGIYVEDGVRTCTFTGSFVSGSRQAGIAIARQDVTVTGRQFLANSSGESADAKGSFRGIIVGFNSRGVVIQGNRSGDDAHADFQSFGCQVDMGATDFVITGNNFRGNLHPGVNDRSSAQVPKVIASNL